jgi:excisionase family DNA binding protein
MAIKHSSAEPVGKREKPIESDSQPLDEFLSPEEVARCAKLTPATVRREIRQGRLKGFRVSRKCIRITRVDMIAWLKAEPIGA